MSFEAQSLKILIMSYLSIFSFVVCLVVSHPRNHFQTEVLEDLPHVLVQECYGLPLKLGLFDPFWVSFCMWCKVRLWLIPSYVAVQFPQHHMLKKLFFPHRSWLPCQKLAMCVKFSFCSIGLCVHKPVLHCLHHHGFVAGFKIRKYELPTLFSFLKMATQGPLSFHMNFRVSLSVSIKTTTGILIGGTLNL